MAASAPSSSGGDPDPNSTNLRPPGYDAWCGVAHGCTRKLGMKICGFLQKNNNLEERSRIVSSFKERTAKNLLSCDNSGGEARFRRTESDFSNLYARGRLKIQRKPVCSLYFNIIIIY
uniref:Glutamate decarboxylase 1 n=1 Tax=Pundamilia nyererei TaxID=303518 RepID=A0A3B4FEP2_9CICH